VALNCAAIAPGLFESELFGYAPGAFTGAQTKGAPGKLALAAGGTVFLDEIGDLPLEQQAKLLRVLESRRWFPIGDSHERQLQARVVCASNLDLLEQVREGRFREDLFYRLKVMRLSLPSLVALPGAVPLLVPRMLKRLEGRIPDAFTSIDEAALRLLAEEPWPGNLRQLWHVLEALCIESGNGAVLRAAVVSEYLNQPGNGSAINAVPARVLSGGRGFLQAPGPEDDWLHPTAALLPVGGFDLDAWQARLIAAALEKNEQSPVKTAAYLHLSRKVLYTLRRRYGLMDEA
jgi:transcriptional regulator with PAS, ATPase and Fis domain